MTINLRAPERVHRMSKGGGLLRALKMMAKIEG